MNEKINSKTTAPENAQELSNVSAVLSKREFVKHTGLALSSGLVASSFSPLSIAAGGEFDSALDKLREKVSGKVITKYTPNYEPWRQSMIWQYRKFKRYPDVIVQARSEKDVISAVKFARDNNVQITSRSGGHSWSGCFLRDNGVLLDLSPLQGVEIDVKNQTAKVEAGVIGRSLSEKLAEVGLAFPTAHCGMVPLSGFLLGGGLGWNSTAWGGMSVFNVFGIDVVTADGKLIHASEKKNPEIFWAARGGGPGLFFTVTRFHIKCYPLPRAITTDTYFFHYSKLSEAVAMMEDVGPTINLNVEMLTVIIPTIPQLAKECEGSECDRIVAVSASAFADTLGEAQEMLAPITNHPTSKDALMSIINRPTPLEVLYQDNEGPFPQRRARADNIYTNDAQGTVGVLSKYMLTAPSDGNTPVILWRGDLSFPDAAYSSTGRFYLAGYAQWDKSENDNANQLWLKDMYDEMKQFASGHYINEYDRETRSGQTDACFAPENWEKLKQLRKKYDPKGVFHDFIQVST